MMAAEADYTTLVEELIRARASIHIQNQVMCD